MNLAGRIFALSTLVAAGFYVFILRRSGDSVVANGGFEKGDFSNPSNSTKVLDDKSNLIANWEVLRGATWSQQRAGGISPEEGDLFVNLHFVDPHGRSSFGGIKQAIHLDPGKDFVLELHVGSAPPDRLPVTIRVTVADAVEPRYMWTYSSPAGEQWHQATFRFDTRSWVASGGLSSTIEIHAPSQSSSFVGIDGVLLYPVSSVFRRFAS